MTSQSRRPYFCSFFRALNTPRQHHRHQHRRQRRRAIVLSPIDELQFLIESLLQINARTILCSYIQQYLHPLRLVVVGKLNDQCREFFNLPELNRFWQQQRDQYESKYPDKHDLTDRETISPFDQLSGAWYFDFGYSIIIDYRNLQDHPSYRKGIEYLTVAAERYQHAEAIRELSNLQPQQEARLAL